MKQPPISSQNIKIKSHHGQRCFGKPSERRHGASTITLLITKQILWI